jgi:hypothetical protein
MKSPFSDDVRRRSLLRIDDSKSGRRRVDLQQRTSISAPAGGPPIDLINITKELTGSPMIAADRGGDQGIKGPGDGSPRPNILG